ncbi:MAG: heme ABC exporter ATP-binding protein CcmA [Gammaproteobacteria bacterium]
MQKLFTSDLVISDLEVWRGDYCACAGWSARVKPGQLLRLGGGNGAGKTSLMRVFAGLALPENGTVRYGVRATPRSAAYRESLRYVAHRDGVKSELSAGENLRLAARLAADSSPGETAAALKRVGLEAFAERRAAELSAGQHRRLALARLLLGKAGLWLLDEPLVGLDRSAVGLVAELVREHLSGGGIAVVATHQTLPLAGVDMLRCDLPRIAREAPVPAEPLEV